MIGVYDLLKELKVVFDIGIYINNIVCFSLCKCCGIIGLDY